MDLSNEKEHKAQENSEIEKDNENSVKEPVEQIKHIGTIEVFDNTSEPKAEPEDDLESTRDTATIQLWLLFTILGDAA